MLLLTNVFCCFLLRLGEEVVEEQNRAKDAPRKPRKPTPKEGDECADGHIREAMPKEGDECADGHIRQPRVDAYTEEVRSRVLFVVSTKLMLFY